MPERNETITNEIFQLRSRGVAVFSCSKRRLVGLRPLPTPTTLNACVPVEWILNEVKANVVISDSYEGNDSSRYRLADFKSLAHVILGF